MRNIGTFFSREQILKLSCGDSWSPLPQAELDGEVLVLHDEAQAQVILSKLRSTCEGVLLAAQENISRDRRCVLNNWKPRSAGH